jgi:hypothetical protein
MPEVIHGPVHGLANNSSATAQRRRGGAGTPTELSATNSPMNAASRTAPAAPPDRGAAELSAPPSGATADQA